MVHGSAQVIFTWNLTIPLRALCSSTGMHEMAWLLSSWDQGICSWEIHVEHSFFKAHIMFCSFLTDLSAPVLGSTYTVLKRVCGFVLISRQFKRSGMFAGMSGLCRGSWAETEVVVIFSFGDVTNTVSGCKHTKLLKWLISWQNSILLLVCVVSLCCPYQDPMPWSAQRWISYAVMWAL